MLRNQFPRGERDKIKRGPFGQRGCGHPAVNRPKPEPRHVQKRPPLVERLSQLDDDLFAIIETDSINVIAFKRPRECRRRMATDMNEGIGAYAAHLAGRLNDSLVFKGMGTGDADELRPAALHPRGGTGTEAKIGYRHAVSLGQEGRTYVFEAEGFDTKKRAEPEFVAPRMGAEKENVHFSCTLGISLKIQPQFLKLL